MTVPEKKNGVTFAEGSLSASEEFGEEDFDDWLIRDHEVPLDKELIFTSRVLANSKARSLKVRSNTEFKFSAFGDVFLVGGGKLRIFKTFINCPELMPEPVENFTIVSGRPDPTPCDCVFRSLSFGLRKAGGKPQNFCLQHEILFCWAPGRIWAISLFTATSLELPHNFPAVHFVDRLFDGSLLVATGGGDFHHCAVEDPLRVVTTFPHKMNLDHVADCYSGPTMSGAMFQIHEKDRFCLFTKNVISPVTEYFRQHKIKPAKIEGKFTVNERAMRIFEIRNKELRLLDLRTMQLETIRLFEHEVEGLFSHPVGRYVYLLTKEKGESARVHLRVFGDDLEREYVSVRLKGVTGIKVDPFDCQIVLRKNDFFELRILEPHKVVRVTPSENINELVLQRDVQMLRARNALKEYLRTLWQSPLPSDSPEELLMTFIEGNLVSDKKENFLLFDDQSEESVFEDNDPIENLEVQGDFAVGMKVILLTLQKPRISPFIFIFRGLEDPCPSFITARADLQAVIVSGDGSKMLSLDTSNVVTVTNLELLERAFILADGVTEIRGSCNKLVFYMFKADQSIHIHDFIKFELKAIVRLPAFLPLTSEFFLHNPSLSVLSFATHQWRYDMRLYAHVSIFERKYLHLNFKKLNYIQQAPLAAAYQEEAICHFENSLFLQRFFHPVFIATLFRKQEFLQFILATPRLTHFSEQSLQMLGFSIALLRRDNLMASYLSHFMLQNPDKIRYTKQQLRIFFQNPCKESCYMLMTVIKAQTQAEGSGFLFPSSHKVNGGISMMIRGEKHFNKSTFILLTNLGVEEMGDFNARRELRTIINRQSNQYLVSRNFSVYHRPSCFKENSVLPLPDRLTQRPSRLDRVLISPNNQPPLYQSLDPVKAHMAEKTHDTDFETRRIDMRVLLLKVDCDFDLRFGTDDSIDFLRFYSTISDTSFVFSNWRYVIEYKWLRVRPIFWLVTTYHSLETAAVFAASFMPNPGGMMYAALVLVGWVALFRLCFTIMLKVDRFNMNGRINTPIGYFVILIGLVMTKIDLMWPDSIEDNTRNFFQVAALTYSGSVFFYCLVNVEPARHLIVMLMTIMVEMIDVLCILGILTVITGFLHFKVNPDETLLFGLKRGFQAIFGGVAADETIMISWINFLVILIIGIIIPIIVINFIIAKMAEAYKRLEKSQKAISLQSRCQAVLEVEYLANRLSKIFRLRNRCTQRQREECQKEEPRREIYTFLAVNPELFEGNCIFQPEQFYQTKGGQEGMDKAAREELADLRRMVNTLVVGVDELSRKIESFRSKEELSSHLALSFGK